MGNMEGAHRIHRRYPPPSRMKAIHNSHKRTSGAHDAEDNYDLEYERPTSVVVIPQGTSRDRRTDTKTVRYTSHYPCSFNQNTQKNSAGTDPYLLHATDKAPQPLTRRHSEERNLRKHNRILDATITKISPDMFSMNRQTGENDRSKL